MALTHRGTKRIDLEHEPGQWLDVRMPSLAILDRARVAQMRRTIEMMSGLDIAALKDLQSDNQTSNAPDYDWLTLLGACVTAWSYDEPVTPANVAELDGVTVKAVLAALLPVETEDERKNA